jgi:outer membrane protein TolC
MRHPDFSPRSCAPSARHRLHFARRARRFALLAALGGLLAGGCSTPSGPDAEAPAPGNSASASPTILSPEKGSFTAPLPSSGRVTLGECIRYGIDRNFRVRAAAQSARAAGAGIDRARAEFDPNFFGTVNTATPDGRSWTELRTSGGAQKKFETGTDVRVEVGQVPRYTGDFRDDYLNNTTAEYALSVRQQLLRGLDPRVNRANIRIAELLRDQAQAARGAEILEMLRAAESGYFAAAVAALSDKSYRASLLRSQSVLGDVRARQAAGAASKLDVLEAEVAVSAARERSLAASKMFADRVDELWQALGSPLGVSAARLAFEPISESAFPNSDPNPAAAMQRALTLAPTAVLLVNEIERREVALRQARNNLLPRLEVEFSAATAQDSGNGSSDWEGLALARISLPWTFRAERAQLEQAKAELERSHVAREEAQGRLRQRINELCRGIAFGRQQLAAARQSQRASLQKWMEQLQRQREGLSTVRELREAEEDLRASEIRVLEARLGLLGAWSTLGQLDGTIAQRHNLPLLPASRP